MAKKNKKEYKEQVSVQVNEVVESELIQIELGEISEEKLMMNEDISQEDETPAIEPMPEIIEEIQEEPCTCIDDCPCNEEIKPIEKIVEAPRKLSVEEYRHYQRTGRLPK